MFFCRRAKEVKNKMRDVWFWKALLNIEEYRWENGMLVHEMTDESFVESCEIYKEQLLLADELFNGIIFHIGIISKSVLFRLLLG